MNTKFRNYYVIVMIVTLIAVLISFGVVFYDAYRVFKTITQPSFQSNAESLYKILTTTYVFHIGFIVVLLNSFGCYLKSKIGPEFKNAYTPNVSVILLYIAAMASMHISGYLTMDYFFISIIILMVFSIITFKQWTTELRLANELRQKKLTIFEDVDNNESEVQAEEVVKINPQVKLMNHENVTEDLIKKMREDRKYLLTRPLNFLSVDTFYSLIVYTAQDEKQRKKMKNLSRLGMLLRCMFLAQLTAVVVFAFQYNHSLHFIIGNLTAPLFWLMAVLTVQFHYHSAMMVFVSEEKFKNKFLLRKGVIYFALLGTFLCALTSPSIKSFLMSLFYFLSSFWIVNLTEKLFRPELNTISKGLLSGTTTAEK